MAYIFDLVLILLGIIGARGFIEQKLPASKPPIDKVVPYQGLIGVTGLAFGIIWAFDWLIHLRYFSLIPFYYIVELLCVLLCICLGLLFGLDSVLRSQQQPLPPLLVKVENLRNMLVPYQREISFGAMGLGVLFLLLGLVY